MAVLFEKSSTIWALYQGAPGFNQDFRKSEDMDPKTRAS